MRHAACLDATRSHTTARMKSEKKCASKLESENEMVESHANRYFIIIIISRYYYYIVPSSCFQMRARKRMRFIEATQLLLQRCRKLSNDAASPNAITLQIHV